MVLLQCLPNEILLDIFSRLHHRDLARASRVSRRLCQISQPLLYRDPFLLKSSPPTPLSAFLRSLFTPGREALATYVRDLTVEWDMGDIWSVTTFRQAQSRRGLDRTQALSGGTQLMMLLHLLPELHGLHLLPPDQCDPFAKLMKSLCAQRRIATLPIALQSLREFRCHWDSRYGGVSVEALVLLLRLPYIRSINISLAREIEVCTPTLNATIVAAAGTSTITHLEFAFVLSRPSSLAGILKIPRALTHFSYFGGRENLDDFDLAAFGTTLQPFQRSLKSLHLDFSNLYSHAIDGDNKPTTTIGSLHNWPVLGTVRCLLLALLGQRPQLDSLLQLADVLPVGASDLEILDDQYWSFAETVHQVVVLLGRKEMVPCLKRVAVYKDYGRDYELVGKLRAACRVAEVELEELYQWRV